MTKPLAKETWGTSTGKSGGCHRAAGNSLPKIILTPDSSLPGVSLRKSSKMGTLREQVRKRLQKKDPSNQLSSTKALLMSPASPMCV